MGRSCFFTEVKAGKLAQYRHYHDNIYPEVARGLRAAGVTQLTIFLVPGTRKLVMYIHTAGDVDLSRATGPGSIYRQNPRCKYWEELMDADFHGGWTKCEEIHSSDKEWNTALQLAPAAPSASSAGSSYVAAAASTPISSQVPPAPPLSVDTGTPKAAATPTHTRNHRVRMSPGGETSICFSGGRVPPRSKVRGSQKRATGDTAGGKSSIIFG